jgi:SAM-dependent methyltransferase
MKYHHFLNPSPKFSNSHLYLVRSSILRSLVLNLESLKGRLLDVGCGQSPYKPLLLSPNGFASEYIGLDLEANPVHKNNPDLLWDGNSIPLTDNYVDSVLLTEVLEHAPEPVLLLKEVSRVLKSGGRLFGTVPFLYPLHEVPWDFYRFTPFAIERFSKESGFNIIKIEALGGWDASLAQMIGLWACQSKLNRIERLFFSIILSPFYRFLLRREKSSMPVDFLSSPMITGLSFILEKK